VSEDRAWRVLAGVRVAFRLDGWCEQGQAQSARRSTIAAAQQ
jgi:hypothetical protein